MISAGFPRSRCYGWGLPGNAFPNPELGILDLDPGAAGGAMVGGGKGMGVMVVAGRELSRVLGEAVQPPTLVLAAAQSLCCCRQQSHRECLAPTVLVIPRMESLLRSDP